MQTALNLLIEERDRLNQAIAILEGRDAPPLRSKNVKTKPAAKPAPTAEPQPTPKKRGRSRMSKAEREATSARMKKYWADRRKAAKKAAKAGK